MTDAQIEKIQAYLSGEMDSDERKAFQQELTIDKDFLAAFNTYRALETHMFNSKKYTSEDALKNSLTKLGDEFFTTASKISSGTSKEESINTKSTFSHTVTKRKFRLATIPIGQIAAAIVFGIAVIGTWYVSTNKKSTKDQSVIIPAPLNDSVGSSKNGADTGLQIPISPVLVRKDTISNPKLNNKLSGRLNNEQLFAKHFQPDAVPEDQEGPLEDAFDQYEKRQFSNAVTSFENADVESVATRGETDIELTRFYASYYKALSYMAIKKDAKAIQLLKKLSGPTPFLQVKVHWYLALAYLRTGDLPKVIPLLLATVKNREAGAYKLKADKLMIELKKQ